MIHFTEEWLAKLLDQNEIVDVLGDYLSLTKRGSRYWASCPWHHEKNPSFCISPDKQMFYCFSCKKGGSVINFIMEQEKLTYPEAITFLAERVGLPLPEETDDSNYRKKKEYQKRLQLLMRDAAMFFHCQLKTEQGKKALAYLQKRGVASQIAPFGLGYAPDSFHALKDELEKKGYTKKEMLDAGVIKQKNGTLYDAFRDRVIFPIQNVYGDVIAFGGRVMKDQEPKYLNSSETAIFNKRNHLYALNIVKKRPKLKRILLVEGYMDVVALNAYGIQTAVASLGTSLTMEQAKLLKRFVDGVYLCYDGDQAGQNAALRGVDILLDAGLQVEVIVLPEKLDPDEYMKKYGVKAFYALAKKAYAGVAFKLHCLKQNYRMDHPDDIVQYGTKAVALIKGLPNEIEKERYLKLIQQETGLSEYSLRAQMGQKKETKEKLPKREIPLPKKQLGDEAKLLCAFFDTPKLLETMPDLDANFFSNPDYRKIFLWLDGQIKKGIMPTNAEIISEFSSDSIDWGELMACDLPKIPALKEDLVKNIIKRLKLEMLKNDQEILLESFHKATGEERQSILQKMNEINQKMRQAKNEM